MDNKTSFFIKIDDVVSQYTMDNNITINNPIENISRAHSILDNVTSSQVFKSSAYVVVRGPQVNIITEAFTQKTWSQSDCGRREQNILYIYIYYIIISITPPPP